MENNSSLTRMLKELLKKNYTVSGNSREQITSLQSDLESNWYHSWSPFEGLDYWDSKSSGLILKTPSILSSSSSILD